MACRSSLRGEFVQPGDGEVVFEEPIPGTGGVEFVVRQYLEREVETPVEFILPLLGEAAGTNHQASPEIAAGDEFLHQQARHDCLSGAGVVCQQEAKWLAG